MFTRQSEVRKRGHVVPMFTRQSDVRKHGHVVLTFTRQSDVGTLGHVPIFTRQSEVRKRGYAVPMFTRQSDTDSPSNKLHSNFFILTDKVEIQVGKCEWTKIGRNTGRCHSIAYPPL